MVKDVTGKGSIYALSYGNHLTFKTMEWEGVTNEEVLDVLIDRLMKLNRQAPCAENIQAIALLGGAKNHLKLRQERIQLEKL